MQRACVVCGTRYEARRVTSKYCSSRCRTRACREQGRTGLVALTGAGAAPSAVLPAAVAESPGAGELVAQVQRELQTANRLDTYLGQAAVDIARRIEATPGAPLSQVAAVHRELRVAVAEAVKGAHQVKSAVQRRRDELEERRNSRRQHA